jgi:hypothetical protein
MTKKERVGKKYGLLPPKIAESDPWVMVCVDLVGPFTIRTSAKTHSLLEISFKSNLLVLFVQRLSIRDIEI